MADGNPAAPRDALSHDEKLAARDSGDRPHHAYGLFQSPQAFR
jgi:hypothetical protein